MLKKVQNLPKKKRELIFWSIIIIVGSVMLFWWFGNAKSKLEALKKEQVFKEIKAPSFGEESNNIKKTQIKENFNKLEEIIKENQE